jgi:predicted transposase/invertase (TIGR01784 family)
MTLSQQLEQKGLKKGLEQGRREEDFVIAKKMLAKRINPSLIKEITGLSDQDLLTLED